MKQIFLSLTLLLTMIVGSISAQTVSEQAAAAKANKFLRQGVHKAKGKSADENTMRLAHKAEKNGETFYYIFNDVQYGGFVIVAGDERATDILGYSVSGNVDFDNAPDNFKWWMKQYEEQIHAAIQQDLQPSVRTSNGASPTRVDVPELVKTKWNQGTPFNNIVVQQSGNTDYVTGCVATAMAQVMKFHGCPTTGVGSHSYTSKRGTTYSADFNVTYDWANMLDSYSNNYTDAQANAVATLMYHAGVSVNMNYYTSSGASSSDIPTALSTYFGYDKSAELVNRKYYTDDEWADVIYNELAAGRPVLYGGQDAYGGGGHEFVCHGYNASDNTFAINWGWGGYCDGYFTLMGVDGLQPNGSGAGGAGEGASYTSSQDAVINVMPDRGGKKPLVIRCISTDNGTVSLSQGGNTVTNATIDLSASPQSLKLTFYPWNLSGEARTFDVAVMLVDKQTGTRFYTQNMKTGRTLAHTYYYTQEINIQPSEFEVNGVYDVYPVVRESGTTQWQRMRFPTTVAVPTITVVGGQAAETKDITFAISGNTVEERGTLTITHDKLYNGNITYAASPEGIVSIDANGVVTALKAGRTTITVTGEEAIYFNRTTATFDVEVTPYVKRNVEFSIDGNYITVGKTLQITCNTPDYDGTITYRSSDDAIATVSPNGTVTAVGVGNAVITVNASGSELFNSLEKTFAVTVTAPSFVMTDFSMPNNGYLLRDQVKFTGTFKNNTELNYSPYYIYCKAKIGYYTITLGSGYSTWYSGYSYDLTFDFCKTYQEHIDEQIGKPCTVQFLDNDKEPLSDVITFYPCNPLEVTYEMTSAGWGTLCLPFEADVPEGLVAYKITGTTGNYLDMEETTRLEMNTPYLISGIQRSYTFNGPDTPVGSSWSAGLLVGNTAPTADTPVYAPEGSYVLQQKNGKLGFYRVAAKDTQRIRQYSAYLDLKSGSKNTYFAISVPTAVSQVENSETNDTYYRINGTRVDGRAKGLVVTKGKIMFNK